MSNWKPIVGLPFTPINFDAYCHSLQWNAWRPSFLVLHNTAMPSLSYRPRGLTPEHIRAFVTYYRDQLKWSAGPHLFIDDKRIWVFTPLTVPGVHSPSWNKQSIGIEMLGDYDTESFHEGRGLLVGRNTIFAMITLCAVLDIAPSTIRLHREDPATTHKCPGKNVVKQEIITEVNDVLIQRKQ